MATVMVGLYIAFSAGQVGGAQSTRFEHGTTTNPTDTTKGNRRTTQERCDGGPSGCGPIITSDTLDDVSMMRTGYPGRVLTTLSTTSMSSASSKWSPFAQGSSAPACPNTTLSDSNSGPKHLPEHPWLRVSRRSRTDPDSPRGISPPTSSSANSRAHPQQKAPLRLFVRRVDFCWGGRSPERDGGQCHTAAFIC